MHHTTTIFVIIIGIQGLPHDNTRWDKGYNIMGDTKSRGRDKVRDTPYRGGYVT